MRSRFLVLAIFSLVGAAPWAQASNNDRCRAQSLMPEDLKQNREMPSPDGQFRAVLSGYKELKDSEGGLLQVFQSRKLLKQFTLRNLSAGIYVKRAPDSAAFYLMWSDGGAIGNYHVRVFRIKAGRVLEVPTTRIAERDFAKRHYCRARANNVYAVHWLADSGEIMVSTEVNPTSDCGKDLGFAAGYVVHTDDGTIVRRFLEAEIQGEIKSCSAF